MRLEPTIYICDQ